MSTGTRLENYILFGISFIAAICFFIAYPSQDPRSAAKILFSQKKMEAKALKKLSDLGFSSNNFTVSDVAFKDQESLLDSLQKQLGRTHISEQTREGNHPNIKPFFWEVEFTNSQKLTEKESSPDVPGQNEHLRLRFDENGTFIGLENPAEYLPQQKVERSALSSVFSAPADSIREPIMAAVSDSLLGRLLYFDMQKEYENYADYQKKTQQDIQERFKQGIPYRHSVNDARALTDHYMSQTGWDVSKLNVDTVFVKRIGTINAADVRYVSPDKEQGRNLRIDAVVAPTGALLQLSAVYNPSNSESGTAGFVWSLIRVILMFGLGLVGLIIFFFRIRARTIDTQSALVAALIMGLIIPVSIFLTRTGDLNPFSGNTSFQDSMILLLQMGFGGAFASICYFVLFSLGDSITRQYWPQKLSTYDYLRQGMIFNKPLGIVLLRGVALSFILCGLWTLISYVFPHAYFSHSSVFLSNQVLWSPLLLLLRNGWFSFAFVLSGYLVIASLVFGRSKKRWLAALLTILFCGIITPVWVDLGPALYEFLMCAILGIAFAYIYIKWDFLTLFWAQFLFLGLLGSASGWLTTNSPDTYIFVTFIIFVALLLITACIAVFAGKDEQALPEYVPSYVEELAQEQRIKQELQIAREVQQSFLPSRVPAIEGLDVAAVCQPAYETGGDYYDFIPLDDHRVAVAIGDVSGKGIQAAFYMTLVKGMLHSLCGETDSPAEVLRKTNRLFYDNATKGTFISLIYGVIDLEKQIFTLARAGHNPILHAKVSSGEVNELRPNGLGIGLTKGKIFDNKIQEIKLSITEDDLFLLYTDGIVEALNQAHQFYGSDKLIKLIKKQKGKSASIVISAISKGVTEFIGKAKQHDDMTLMAIRFEKKQ